MSDFHSRGAAAPQGWLCQGISTNRCPSLKKEDSNHFLFRTCDSSDELFPRRIYFYHMARCVSVKFRNSNCSPTTRFLENLTLVATNFAPKAGNTIEEVTVQKVPSCPKGIIPDEPCSLSLPSYWRSLHSIPTAPKASRWENTPSGFRSG